MVVRKDGLGMWKRRVRPVVDSTLVITNRDLFDIFDRSSLAHRLQSNFNSYHSATPAQSIPPSFEATHS
jgi:hypothetical protein